jgi:hypothetical protein
MHCFSGAASDVFAHCAHVSDCNGASVVGCDVDASGEVVLTLEVAVVLFVSDWSVIMTTFCNGQVMIRRVRICVFSWLYKEDVDPSFSL